MLLPLFRFQAGAIGAGAAPATAAVPADEQVRFSRQRLTQVPAMIVAWDQSPLGEILEGLRRDAGVPFVARWRPLAVVGVSAETPITARFQNVKLSKIVEILVQDVSSNGNVCYFVNDNGDIVITTREDYVATQTVTRMYDVRRMVADPEYRPAAIMRRIVETIDPGGWKQEGGTPGTISERDGWLTVTQLKENHEQLQEFLKQLGEAQQQSLWQLFHATSRPAGGREAR